MIRGNDAEQVNEIINYLVIYWESAARARAPIPPHISLLKPPLPQRAFVLIET